MVSSMQWNNNVNWASSLSENFITQFKPNRDPTCLLVKSSLERKVFRIKLNYDWVSNSRHLSVSAQHVLKVAQPLVYMLPDKSQVGMSNCFTTTQLHLSTSTQIELKSNSRVKVGVFHSWQQLTISQQTVLLLPCAESYYRCMLLWKVQPSSTIV
jgi:hypothetical protein